MTPVGMQALPSDLAKAQRIAARLSLPLHEIALHRFPDEEIKVTVGPAAGVTILHASLDRPNEKILALLFAADALRRAGTRRLVLVAPYLCYMRQDTAFNPGEAVSQAVIGRLLAGSFDRVVTVDAHLHRTRDIRAVFPGIEADNLSAMPAIADALRAEGFDPRTVIVGPDAESESWVRDLAGRLPAPHAVARKVRHGDRAVEIALPDPAAVAGRPVLIVDDLVSSGGTLLVLARALAEAGASAIDAIVTHALFPPQMQREFASAGIRSVRSTTSVAHPTNAISLSGLLADALRGELQAAPQADARAAGRRNLPL